MPRVVHFEIHADDPARAADFYTKLFGWQISKWEGPADYWLVTTGPDDAPGINGAIMQRQGQKVPDMAVIGYVFTIDVDEIDRYLALAGELGAEVALAKHTIPGVGYQAFLKDPEGNIFGLHQFDSSVS